MAISQEHPEVKLAPSTWMRETGIRVSDIDGWTTKSGGLDPKDFQDPISREEFIDRCMISTTLRWPRPPYDEREEPSDWFVSRLAEALKSEFGTQFGMGMNAPDEEWKRVARGLARKMRVGEHDMSDVSTMIVAFDPTEDE
jgi:hypothetical protein